MKPTIVLSIWLIFLLQSNHSLAQFSKPTVIEIDANGNILKAPSKISGTNDLIFKLIVPKQFTFPNYTKFKEDLDSVDAIIRSSNFTTSANWLVSEAVVAQLSEEITVLKNYTELLDTIKNEPPPITATTLKYLPSVQDVRALKLIPIKISITRDNKTIETLDFKWNEREKCYIAKLESIDKFISGDNRIQFDIIEENRYNTLILNHFKKLNKSLNPKIAFEVNAAIHTLKLNSAIVDKQKIQFKELMETITREPEGCYVDQLKAINNALPKNLISLLEDIKIKASNINSWLIGWTWYNYGLIKVNPFSFTSSDKIKKKVSETIKPVIDTKFTKPFNKSIDNALQKLSTNRKVNNADSVLMLKEKSEQGLKKLSDSTEINKAISTNNTLFTAQQMNERLLSKGDLVVSNSGEINYNRYHFANLKYELKQTIKLRDYPGNYNIYLNTINLPKKYKVTIKQTFEKFDDKPEFTSELKGNLDSISSLQGLLVKSISTSTFSALKSFTDKKVEESSTCKDQLFLIDLIKSKFVRFYFFEESEFEVPSSLISKRDTSNYIYSNALLSGTPKEESYSNTYIITQTLNSDTTKKINTSAYTFNVSKLRTVQFAAGLAFNSSYVRETTVDTSTGQFSTNYEEQKARFILGVKLYPFKTFLRDNGIIPRWPLRRVSIFGGFDVVQPLKSLYIGLGYDIVPGLNLNFGRNYSKHTFYEVANNKIISSASRLKDSGNYFSVTLDPELVVGLLKIMFK